MNRLVRLCLLLALIPAALYSQRPGEPVLTFHDDEVVVSGTTPRGDVVVVVAA